MDADAPPGRNVRDLGLCVVEDSCRTAGHSVVRAVLPETAGSTPAPVEVCLDCTEAEGRLEGLRLWESVCPCCFSTAFPDGLPTLGREHAAATHSRLGGRRGGSTSPPAPRTPGAPVKTAR